MVREEKESAWERGWYVGFLRGVKFKCGKIPFSPFAHFLLNLFIANSRGTVLSAYINRIYVLIKLKLNLRGQLLS